MSRQVHAHVEPHNALMEELRDKAGSSSGQLFRGSSDRHGPRSALELFGSCVVRHGPRRWRGTTIRLPTGLRGDGRPGSNPSDPGSHRLIAPVYNGGSRPWCAVGVVRDERQQRTASLRMRRRANSHRVFGRPFRRRPAAVRRSGPWTEQIQDVVGRHCAGHRGEPESDGLCSRAAGSLPPNLGSPSLPIRVSGNFSIPPGHSGRRVSGNPAVLSRATALRCRHARNSHESTPGP